MGRIYDPVVDSNMLPQVANIAINSRITLKRPKPEATIALSKSAGASSSVAAVVSVHF